ncbi:MAG: tryptophan synthase subunit alpha [Candidatus Omnitrophica bacterium]|nr:tryptophan synthase subunit alpha [Candidatus Omnitrophota bacterium]
MNRIEEKFKTLKENNQKAFIAFITAGYPNLGTTKRLVLEFSRVGVDIVELGVPFSDPMADGPIIQESSQVALENKINLNVILNFVKTLRKSTDIPICLMSYYNPIFCFGEERFVKRAKEVGVDGVVIPDLPPEEGRNFIKLSHQHNLDVICFISPTTSLKRAKYNSRISRGFIYYVSLTGVTGPRQKLSPDIKEHLYELKKITSKPICVGFGVANPRQVKEIYTVADGVIVGSAIIKKLKDNLRRKDAVKIVGKFISYLKNV